MKFLYTLLFLLLGVVGFAQFNPPVDFESMTTLSDFGGNTSTVVTDPTNASNMVAQSIKGANAETWAGTTLGPPEGFDDAIPFNAAQTSMTVRVWSPDANIPVLFKVEDSTNGDIFTEIAVNTSVAMDWETLTFNFANANPALDLANNYDKASIFFNFGTDGATAGEKTYYWDDVELVPAPVIDSSVVDVIVNSPNHMTLETAVLAAGLEGVLSGPGSFTVFAPTDAAFAALPAGVLDALLMDPNGALTQVLLYHVLGAEVLSTDLSDGQMATTLQGADITVMIDGNNNVFINNAQVTAADISTDNGVVHVIDAVLIPPTPLDLPITFDDANVDYDLTDFGGNASSIIVDPTDSDNMVGQAVRTAGAEVFAGTTMGNNGLANAIPFSVTQSQMSVRVWSPEADIPVRLKVEDTANGAISVETEANTTVAMAWDTLTFNFNNNVMGTPPLDTANTYDKISIFFNFGASGVGEQTYYWDDVEFLPAPDSTVVDVVVNSPNHTTLETAVIAAGLADDLSGAGPFTVFAPTDDAFNALPAGALDALLMDPTGALAQVLLYHVLGAEVLSTDLSDGQMAATLQGANITVMIDGNNNVFINNAQVTAADIRTDNGVVHVIDAVLLPPLPVDLPITFEDGNVNYDLVDFGGNASSIVMDPTDPNNMVGQAVRTAGAETFAGTTMGGNGLANAIPFSAAQTQMTVRVWSPDANVPVRLKVEDAANGAISVETEVNTTVAMDWETLTFNFNNEAPGTAPINLANTYDKISIFFNFGATGVGEQTYYWDDVELVPLPDSTVVDVIVNSPVHTTLETAVIAAGLDDDLSGTGPFTVFAPTDDAFDALPAGALDALLMDPTGALAQVLLYHVLGAQVLSTDLTDGQMAATLQGADITVMIDGSNNVFINNAQVTAADILTDNGVVHVIDAVLLPPAQVDLPITFEDANVDYDLTDFGGNASSIVMDPTDPNNMVGQAVRTAGAETFAGTTMGNSGLATAIPFSDVQTSISVRVWSPDANTPVRLKVEDAANGAISVETEVNTSVAMDWETLTFNFNNEAPGTAPIDLANTYDKISIFFNFGATGVGEQTYYWDDVEFLPAPVIDSTVVDVIVNSPVHTTLETAVIAAGLDDDLSGVGPFTVFAPTDDAFDALPAGALDALLMDPTGALAQVLLYHVLGAQVLSTDLTDGQMAATLQGADITVMIDGSNNVFINNAQVTAADILTDNGVVHVIDAVLLPPARVDLPITFEDAGVDYDLTDFGGNISSIVVDPTDPNNMVGQAVRTAGAETFAGTTMGNDGLANPVPFTMTETKMKVRVWSPDADTPIRLKVEDATNPAISVETETNTTVAMAWETIEFDFSNEAPGTAALDLANTYDKISIFFDFGASGVGEQTYYWDDVEFGERVTVVDIVVNSADHETLETAVVAAELADDLSGAGPFTVFAPTDDAFDALPPNLLNVLLADPTGDLEDILLYHVLGAEVFSTDLTDGQMATTLQGEDITVTIDGSDIFINQALVTMADIETDNGVVHVINAVILPPTYVGVETLPAEEFGILVSPNPANSFVNIQFPEALNEEVRVTLFDLSGKVLSQSEVYDQLSQFNTSTLSPGTYFMRIDTSAASYYHKLMIAR
ncbi:MAG: fasciclin domain-containing protein [Bacteroidota bacterium]